MPSLCAQRLQNTSGPNRLAAERTLARLLKVCSQPWCCESISALHCTAACPASVRCCRTCQSPTIWPLSARWPGFSRWAHTCKERPTDSHWSSSMPAAAYKLLPCCLSLARIPSMQLPLSCHNLTPADVSQQAAEGDRTVASCRLTLTCWACCVLFETFDCVQADEGPETAQAVLASGQAGSLARTYLTDSYLRRLGRLPPEDEDWQLLA